MQCVTRKRVHHMNHDTEFDFAKRMAKGLAGQFGQIAYHGRTKAQTPELLVERTVRLI